LPSSVSKNMREFAKPPKSKKQRPLSNTFFSCLISTITALWLSTQVSSSSNAYSWPWSLNRWLMRFAHFLSELNMFTKFLRMSLNECGRYGADTKRWLKHLMLKCDIDLPNGWFVTSAYRLSQLNIWVKFHQNRLKK